MGTATRNEAASADGVRLVYEVDGVGAPSLAFVHGWSCDRRYWSRQLGHFARTRRVVALDLAGHGEAGAGRTAYTMAAFGEDVVAVMDDAGIDRAVLIGQSMGGDVIVAAARLIPDRIEGLVWVDTHRTLGNPRSPEQIEAFLAPFRADFAANVRKLVRGFFLPTSDPALAEWVAADMSSAPPEVGLSALEHAISYEQEILDALRELRVPIIAINPDYRPTDADALSRFGVRVVIVLGVGHFPMMENPETFNRVLGEALAGFG